MWTHTVWLMSKFRTRFFYWYIKLVLDFFKKLITQEQKEQQLWKCKISLISTTEIFRDIGVMVTIGHSFIINYTNLHALSQIKNEARFLKFNLKKTLPSWPCKYLTVGYRVKFPKFILSKRVYLKTISVSKKKWSLNYPLNGLQWPYYNR